MIKRIFDFLFQAGYIIILGLACLLLTLFTLQAFAQHTYIPIAIAESVKFVANPWYFGLLVFAFIGFLFAVRPVLDRVDARWLFWIACGLYIVGAFYLIAHVDGNIRADAKHVYNAARAFNAGNYSSLTTVGAYMYRNPHQLGLMTLERLLIWISPHTQFVFGINLVWLLGSFSLLVGISSAFAKNERTTKYTILLLFLFYPSFFFILFAYGSTPGLFFCLLALWSFLQVEKGGSWLWMFLGAASMAAGCLIRNNYMIFALTLVAVLGLSFLRRPSWKQPLAVILMVAAISLSNKALMGHYEKLVGHEIGEGTPKIAYVTMGLRDDPNRQTLGGWYDAYNTKILKRNQFDEKKAKTMATRDLKKLLLTFTRRPAYALKFFYEKVKSTWTEPTFQSIWTGPQLERNQHAHTPLLRSIYEEGSAYQALNLWGSVYLTAIYLLTAAFILYKLFWSGRMMNAFELYSMIFFLGGFTFHLFWETKSQYVYMYVFLLIPMAARSLNWIIEKTQKGRRRRTLQYFMGRRQRG